MELRIKPLEALRVLCHHCRAAWDRGHDPPEQAEACTPNYAISFSTIFPATSVSLKFLPWNLYVSFS
ncbi:hypothetical protein Pan44_55090 [Caulifigura coniformis]|uniref:Uncharacterized protein n=1 Tax=Caulifigura coniformis TaxID=2527983 RepID=A0A517SMU7_9PLAN|nr:hypothetical protein Pan44_55090 [Caulifigura coniformis]